MLGRELFGEPAWDMLLACYCLPARGEMLSVTSVAHAADVPGATGHRWMQTLLASGLIERGPKVRDGRRQIVRLSRRGKELLEEYLTRLLEVDVRVPPYPNEAGR